MTTSTMYALAAAAVLILTAGGGVGLAVLFRLTNQLVVGDGRLPRVVLERVVVPTEPMALLRWRREQDEERMAVARRVAAYRSGATVLVVLAALTVFEYVMNLVGISVFGLFVIALVKAAIIVHYFMHVATVFAAGDGH
ncbi:hypothetical protein EMGBD1_19110 [Anaerolineaceae bacterium]|nr:hypothetical protein EMGBD1_19110 [Anaerolineaceae bacterium]